VREYTDDHVIYTFGPYDRAARRASVLHGSGSLSDSSKATGVSNWRVHQVFLARGPDCWFLFANDLQGESALHDGPDDDNPVILVIDDDPDVRAGFRALFESVSLQCEAFGSAQEFLRSEIPDQVRCLILDVRLPGLSGLEFQTEVQIDIPIIFVTGHGDIPMSVRAMKAGAVEFLTKPIREQDLLDAVRIALDRDRKRRERRKRAYDLRTRFGTLSTRERQVMTLVTDGLMNKQVAAEIGVSEVTVKVHRHNLMQKIEAKSLAELVKMADALGLSHKDRNERT
jgi:FixJ family two-component response regulator